MGQVGHCYSYCDILDSRARAVSLALGREPTLPPRVGRDPDSIFDFESDDDLWVPFYVNPSNCPPSLMGYAQPKRAVVTFRSLARLAMVCDLILVLDKSV